MFKSGVVFLFLSLSFSGLAQQTLELEGKWYVHYSNFPMWLKGDKKNPTFNYIDLGNGKILDQVKFYKKGKLKTITGFDKPLNKAKTSFLWRGQGLLFIARSRWSIFYQNPEKQWIIIGFKKTLFTPQGYDVISRENDLDTGTKEEIIEKLDELIPGQNLLKIKQVER